MRRLWLKYEDTVKTLCLKHGDTLTNCMDQIGNGSEIFVHMLSNNHSALAKAGSFGIVAVGDLALRMTVSKRGAGGNSKRGTLQTIFNVTCGALRQNGFSF